MTLARFYNKSFFWKVGLVTLAGVLVYKLASTHIQLVLTATPSLPYRLFVLSKRDEPSLVVPQNGSYILFYNDFTKTKVLKQVRGIPGSRVHFDTFGQLWIDDFYVGRPHEFSSDGKRVHPFKAGIIPKGYVFVYASHDRSFDSRYEEFGLVSIESILGVGVAVL